MAERYDARDLDEPSERVRRHVLGARVAASAAAIVGLGCDLGRVHVNVCGMTPCRWFQRSGAIVVVCGTYLAFRSGAVLIKWIQYRDQRPIHGINPKPSRDYGWAAFWLLVVGTLIWDFGDWVGG